MSSTFELIEKSLRILPNSTVADMASSPVTTDNAMNMIFFRNKPHFGCLIQTFLFYFFQQNHTNLPQTRVRRGFWRVCRSLNIHIIPAGNTGKNRAVPASPSPAGNLFWASMIQYLL